MVLLVWRGRSMAEGPQRFHPSALRPVPCTGESTLNYKRNVLPLDNCKQSHLTTNDKSRGLQSDQHPATRSNHKKY